MVHVSDYQCLRADLAYIFDILPHNLIFHREADSLFTEVYSYIRPRAVLRYP